MPILGWLVLVIVLLAIEWLLLAKLPERRWCRFVEKVGAALFVLALLGLIASVAPPVFRAMERDDARSAAKEQAKEGAFDAAKFDGFVSNFEYASDAVDLEDRNRLATISVWARGHDGYVLARLTSAGWELGCRYRGVFYPLSDEQSGLRHDVGIVGGCPATWAPPASSQ